MPKPKRNLHAIDQETTTPPDALTATQAIARVHSAAGNNLYRLELPSSSASPSESTSDPANASPSLTTVLAELPLRFRHTIWIKRGMYVLVDTEAMAARDNKLGGEIVNIVREEKEWRKMAYWPKEFPVGRAYVTGGDDDSSSEEEDRGPQMPESEDED
jgi:probable RNA-binding protein EIF1AD